ncbi:MAG: hypothetical protein AAFO98_04655, partial [Pseudomonadota bacterium]
MAVEKHHADTNRLSERIKRSRAWFVLTFLVGVLSPLLMVMPAKADAGFERWKSAFAKTAVQNGIKRSTFRAAFAGVDS